MVRWVTIKKVFREYPIRIILSTLCILSFMGFNFWDYYAPLSIHEWNKKEISRIKVTDLGNFTFAVFGDNKGNYSFLKPLLEEIAQDKEIAFAIDTGDLVSGGKRGRYRRFLNQVQETLTIPFLTAMGNHDGKNGFGNYRDIFGPTYYAFQVGQAYFLVLDAAMEARFDKTERRWLEDELQKAQTSKIRFVFMHVPPFDPRGNGFNKCLPEKDGKDLIDLFRHYHVTHLFASHIHGYFSGVWEGIPYTITGGAGARLQGSDPQHFFHHYIKVHVQNGAVALKVMPIRQGNGGLIILDLIEANNLQWGLPLGACFFLLTVWLSMRRKHLKSKK